MKAPAKLTAQLTSATAILSGAIVSDNLRLKELPVAAQMSIVVARINGLHPVSVRWATGQYAILICGAGTDMPNPLEVVEAYRQCLKTSKTFPDGEISCKF